MSPILFLTDLDHNLFQSLRVDSEGLYPMTVNKTGKPHCYATKAQLALMQLMMRNAFCVAVTARTPEQMMRVTGWSTNQEHNLALTDLGMTMLYRHKMGEWQIIEEWSEPYLAKARSLSLGLQVDFDQFQKTLNDHLSEYEGRLSYNLNFCHEDMDVPFYFLAQQTEKNTECQIPVDVVRAACKQFLDECQGEYFYHESEGTFAMWPSYVSKFLAVERLMSAFDEGMEDERFELAREEKGRTDLVLASGDSMSDLPFMQMAHFWLAPGLSQISTMLMPDQVMPFTTNSYE